MIPEEVLDVFQEWQRFAIAYDQSLSTDELLDFNSTVAHWRTVCELKRGSGLGRYLNKVFSLDADDDQWKIVLHDDTKMFTLCDFIAERSHRQSISNGPIALIGVSTSHERMFKALRGRLVQQGLPLQGAIPSTPLEPYVVQHFDALVGAVLELSPGALPNPDLRWKTVNPFSVTLGFAAVYLLFQFCYRYSASVWGSILFTVIMTFFVLKFWDKHHAGSYFQDIETLGDLTRIMVVNRRRSLSG